MEYDLPTGYRPLRTLSERDGSWVYLAINSIGKHCCLKVQRVVDSESLTALRGHRDRLPEITSGEGFIPLVCHGAFPDQGILWEELALADDSITGRPFDAAWADDYTPLTLALRVAESGPASTTEVITQGLRLCRALAHLHRQSLYHRDVKPANVLVYQGRWVLGDYGSVGEAGATVEFPGTEGYVPPDGLGSPRLDVFALGRSLYEAWTGLDRFQFPSLPPHVTRSEDWETHGWLLNHALAHAANPLPSARFQSAELLVEALERARRGRKRWSRCGEGCASRSRVKGDR